MEHSININGVDFMIARLKPWSQIKFAADLQKDLVTPIFSDSTLMETLKSQESTQASKIITALSKVMDGEKIEFWMRRILSENLVFKIDNLNKKSPLLFEELDTTFNSSSEIFAIFKEVFRLNLQPLLESIGSSIPKK